MKRNIAVIIPTGVYELIAFYDDPHTQDIDLQNTILGKILLNKGDTRMLTVTVTKSTVCETYMITKKVLRRELGKSKN